MECRKMELTLVSANSLPVARTFGRMKVYAKASITGESKTSKKTPADREGEINPTWNFTIGYMVTESAIRQPDSEVVVKLFCKRKLGDRFVGEVKIPIKSLFDNGLKADKVMSYQVCGTPTGKLNVLYSFGEIVLVRKSSGFRWKNAVEVGFLALLGGAMLLLGDIGDDDGPDGDDGNDDGDGGGEVDDEDEDNINDDGFYDCN